MATKQKYFNASSAPTTSDDNTQGYEIGDAIFDTTNDTIYDAIDVSTGAAIWIMRGTYQKEQPYQLSVSVSSNNLTVALKNSSGTDPSATEPVNFSIDGTIRSVTSALSITLAAGTNWFNSGGYGLAARAVPYFVYAVWDSNSSAVALTIGRKSHYRLVSQTSGTTTDEEHIYGYSGFTTTDDMANIGYFEATLSAGAGYTWTVPTFTSNNLRSETTLFSRWMTWLPVDTGFSNDPTGTTKTASYKVGPHRLIFDYYVTAYATSNATTYTSTLPFRAVREVIGVLGYTHDNSTNAASGTFQILSVPSNVMTFKKSANAAWTAANNKGAYINNGMVEI